MTSRKNEKKLTWMQMSKEDLILELGRYEKKVRDQWEEMKRLRTGLQEYESGIAELNTAVNIALAKVIEKYGSYGYGGKFIALPAETDVDAVVGITADKVGDLHVILIKDKTEEKAQ